VVEKFLAEEPRKKVSDEPLKPKEEPDTFRIAYKF